MSIDNLKAILSIASSGRLHAWHGKQYRLKSPPLKRRRSAIIKEGMEIV